METILNKIISFIKHHKKLFIITFIIIIIAIIIITTIELTRNASLRISVTPTDSTITINGKNYTNGTYKFHPGTYTATISHQDFDSKEVTIELQSNKTIELNEYLTQGQKLDHYSNNKTDFIVLQNIYNNDLYTGDTSELNNYFDNYKKIVDIRRHLPIAEFIDNPQDPSTKYAILIKESTEPCEQLLCLLVIDETEKFHSQALDIIKKYGYDPNNYKISYSKNSADF